MQAPRHLVFASVVRSQGLSQKY